MVSEAVKEIQDAVRASEKLMPTFSFFVALWGGGGGGVVMRCFIYSRRDPA